MNRTLVGFTMSVFIAMLAFHADEQLIDAKLGILLGSGLSALVGLGLMKLSFKQSAKETDMAE